jgi:hypothetical protein
MMSSKGFKEYKITDFNSDVGIIGTEIKIKAGEESIELDSSSAPLNLTGTNLSVNHHLGLNHKKVITGNFFETYSLQAIQVLGAEFNSDYELTFSISSINEDDKTRFKEALEFNRKIYTYVNSKKAMGGACITYV